MMTVSRKELLRVLKVLSGPKNLMITDSEYILVKPFGDRVTMHRNCMDWAVSDVCDVTYQNIRPFMIPYRQLRNYILSDVIGDGVEIRSLDTFQIEVLFEKSSKKMTCKKGVVSFVSGSRMDLDEASIRVDVLKDILETHIRTLPTGFASVSDGVFVSIQDGMIEAFATDQSNITHTSMCDSSNATSDLHFGIPKKIVPRLLSFLKNARLRRDQVLYVADSGYSVRFRTFDNHFVSMTKNLKRPRVGPVIAMKMERSFAIISRSLWSSLRKTVILGDVTQGLMVHVEIIDNQPVVSIENRDSSIFRIVPFVAVEGVEGDVRVSIPLHHLLHFLTGVKDERVLFEFGDSDRDPCRLSYDNRSRVLMCAGKPK